MHYKTPYQGGAIRSWHIGKGFLHNQIDCEVITIHNKPGYEVHIIDGQKVHYLPVKYHNSFGFLKRIVAFWKYNLLAYHLIKRIPPPQLIYAISTPLTVGKLALKIKKKLKVPFVFEIGDIWPEAPIQMGVLRNAQLIKYFKKLEKHIYKSSSGLISLSPAITSYLKNKTDKVSVIEIPNFSDLSFFSKTTSKHSLRFFSENYFTIVSAGAIGKANHLDFVIQAAAYMHKKGQPVAFVIMGEGSEKERLQSLSKKLPNIKFLNFAPRKYVKEVLENSDAVYLSYKNIPILETGSPNRYFDALAAGKLIITNFGGWISELNKKHDCGFQTDPLHPSDLLDKLKPFLSNKELLKEKGHNARVLSNFYKPEEQLKKLSDWVKNLEL